jgi:hypothetical protein
MPTAMSRSIGRAMIALTILALGAVRPSTAAGQSPGSPVLVELFTAEGCSSCPPADQFLRQLDASQPIAGAHLIVLGEHVDYWDHQGWADPFSSAALTERQRSYVRALGLREAYTPQFIVDGESEMRLNERQKIAPLLTAAAAARKIPVSIEALTLERGPPAVLRGHIDVEAGVEPRKGSVYLGLALDHFESKVLRGENRGQLLTHVAVLFDLIKLGSLPANAKFSQDFRVPLKAGIDPDNVRVIAFAQEGDQGKVLGATLERTAGLR